MKYLKWATNLFFEFNNTYSIMPLNLFHNKSSPLLAIKNTNPIQVCVTYDGQQQTHSPSGIEEEMELMYLAVIRCGACGIRNDQAESNNFILALGIRHSLNEKSSQKWQNRGTPNQSTETICVVKFPDFQDCNFKILRWLHW